jgi:hypothetical protein
MMIALRSEKGDVVAVGLLGYQFPNLISEPWDSDWLNVQLDLTDADRAWSRVDPCLLTFEARELATWLREVAECSPSPGMLYFTEPCLAFEVVRENANSVVLRVFLSHEFRPPWAECPVAEDAYSIDLIIARSDLLEASASLSSQLTLFPERAGR